MNNSQTQKKLKSLLKIVKNIALVGVSSNPDRDSYKVMKFLIDHGYKVLPVNPNETSNKILGKRCFPNLKSIEERVDMVNLFRSKEFIFGHTKEAIEIKANILWMQEGIIHEEAAEHGRAAGMVVVMDECPKKILEIQDWTN